ncbi:MAG: ABC transporter ATP-binding protein [Tepidisphaeraceae bacterium]
MMVAINDDTFQDDDDADRSVVEIKGISRRFGAKLALDRVSLSIPTGCVLGLVGENGAGKTTMIKHVLGLLRAESGTVRVFGLDPAEQPVHVLAQIGYLSEEPDLPGWMRVRELLRYVQAFYPSWDEKYADSLREQFALDPNLRVRALSKGQRARVGLIAALAYRPALLVLDEPSSGLDPVVRRDILTAIIRTIADEGRTVLFSSHLLSEVERVSDRVAMLKAGRIVFSGDLAEVKQSYRRVTLRFDQPLASPPALAGGAGWSGSGQEWTALFNVPAEQVEWAATPIGGRIVQSGSASLDEIFFARTGAAAPAAHAEA